MDEMEKFYKEMEGKTLVELIHLMNEEKIRVDHFSELKAKSQKIYDALRINLIPSVMDEQGISTIKVDDVGRVSLTGDIYASIPATCKNEAWNWLRDHGYGGIIQETINAGTLKSTLKGIIKQGDPELQPPEDLFKITPFTRASITKA